jgi:hypothetical protein
MSDNDEFDDSVFDDDLRPGADAEARASDATAAADDPDTTDENPASWTDRLAAAGGAVAFAPLVALAPLLSVLPASWRVFHKLHLWSAIRMQRAASADALANVRLSSGREDVLPAKFVDPADDDKHTRGWRVKSLGKQTYDPAVNGRASQRLGKASIIHINEDDPEQATWAETTIDTAFQLGRERYLFRDAEVNADVSVYAAPGDGGEAGQAVADGGNESVLQRATVTTPGVLHDTLVPLSSRPGYDGTVVSWSQFADIKTEKTDQDRIKDSKNAGWMAAKMDDLGSADLMKWVLIGLVVGAVLLFHAEIGAFIAGLSSSGGGDAVGGAAGAAGDALGAVLPTGGS